MIIYIICFFSCRFKCQFLLFPQLISLTWMSSQDCEELHLENNIYFLITLPSLKLILVFLHHEVVYTLCVAINHIFNLMYEYMIYVAQAEDINLFCRERGGDNSADVPLLIGWLNSVCSL